MRFFQLLSLCLSAATALPTADIGTPGEDASIARRDPGGCNDGHCGNMVKANYYYNGKIRHDAPVLTKADYAKQHDNLNKVPCGVGCHNSIASIKSKENQIANGPKYGYGNQFKGNLFKGNLFKGTSLYGNGVKGTNFHPNGFNKNFNPNGHHHRRRAVEDAVAEDVDAQEQVAPEVVARAVEDAVAEDVDVPEKTAPEVVARAVEDGAVEDGEAPVVEARFEQEFTA